MNQSNNKTVSKLSVYLFLLALLSLSSSFFFTASLGQPPYNYLLTGSALVVSSMLCVLLMALSFLSAPIFRVSSLLLIACFYLITVTNWWHSQYFGSYYSFFSLAFGLTNEAGDALKAISAFKYTTVSLVWGLVLLITWLILACTVPAVNSKKLKITLLMLTLLSAVSVNSLYLQQVLDMRKVNAFVLSPKIIHPVLASFFDLDAAVESTNESKAAWASLKKNNRYLQAAANSTHSGKYNVIVLVLESFEASMIGHYGNDQGLTPNFDRLAKQSIVAKNFYANSNFTVKGENAISCGVIDFNLGPSVAEFNQEINLHCLPEIFKGLGYQTHYFHGNYSSFYNRHDYLPQIGYDHLYFQADIDKGAINPNLSYIGWGVSDHDLYEIGLDKLVKQDSPFFAHFMSLSNHYPFNHQWPIAVPSADVQTSDLAKDDLIYESFKNSIYYTDYALGEFWKKLESTGLDKNTIVVVTADHGVSTYPKSVRGNEALQYEYMYRLPLLIHHPDMAEPKEIQQVSSQIDVLPTLLSFFDLADENDARYLGKNMLRPVDKPWSVMVKGQSVLRRSSDKLCFISFPNCKRNCSIIYQSDKAFNLDALYQCVDAEGDLLQLAAENVNAYSGLNIENHLEVIRVVREENSRLLLGESSMVYQPKHKTQKKLLRELGEKPQAIRFK